MNPRLGIFLIFLLPLLWVQSLAANSLFQEVRLAIIPGQMVYDLGKSKIIIGSEQVQAQSGTLKSGEDYLLDWRTGQLTLLMPLADEFIHVSFILIPTRYSEPSFLYQERAATDSLFQTIKPSTRQSWWQDDGKLLISGSKTFAISFSEESAFDLKQSLYVNLSGELTDGVQINAQLSDSQSKLSPEGDSKELSSLDQVFVKIQGKSWNLEMGDLEMNYGGSRYLDYNSRFEGVAARLGKQSHLHAAYSVGGGKNTHVDIPIIDGKQGPYYLNLQGQPGSLLIIAGSESVYQNGSLLERGSDYYIDYSEGTLMFRRLVFSTDKISVWFKYADENYSRHSILSNASWQIIPGLSLTGRVITASDNKDKPLLYEFSAQDLDSLYYAGDSDAWGEGAILVEPGQGTYRLITGVDGSAWFEYADADSLADYNVYFSYVGPGEGDYIQFSHGKFRYVGAGLGEWLPQKQLVAPSSITNAAVGLRFDRSGWDLGVEAVFSHNDANTLSPLDDDDNQGGYLYSWLGFTGKYGIFAPLLLMDYEKRLAYTKLISDYSASIGDYDLGAALPADSLAFDSFSMRLGLALAEKVKPELTLKQINAEGGFEQRLMRFIFSSPQYWALPRLELRSTLAQTQNPALSSGSGTTHYEFWDASWKKAWLKLGGILNLQHFVPDDPQHIESRFLRLNPYTELGDAKSFQTRLAYIADDTKTATDASSHSQHANTLSWEQSISSPNHNLNLDYSRRSVKAQADSSKTFFNLINLRSSDNFLRNALVILSNYQLNQTEFFPRIRELEYVGSGIGLYDSTGVAIPDGDWDYVYITSPTGGLSAELNAQANIYLKPGNLSKSDLLRRINSDLLISGSRQKTGNNPDWKSYLFLPQSATVDSTLIYDKHSFVQNVWLELYANKANLLLSYDMDKTQDNRYQEQNTNRHSLRGVKLELNRIGDYSFSFGFEDSSERDSRYQSLVQMQRLLAYSQRNLRQSTILRLDADLFNERGSSTHNSDAYRLYGLGISPGFRSTWGKKGRLAASVDLRHNWREGDQFLSFLPQKRAGFSLGANLNGIYRLNAYSTISLDYSIKSYPQEKLNQQLKLEFKAEL